MAEQFHVLPDDVARRTSRLWFHRWRAYAWTLEKYKPRKKGAVPVNMRDLVDGRWLPMTDELDDPA